MKYNTHKRELHGIYIYIYIYRLLCVRALYRLVAKHMCPILESSLLIVSRYVEPMCRRYGPVSRGDTSKK